MKKDLGRKAFVLGFPKAGTSTLHKALKRSGLTPAHWRVKEGYVGKLMYDGLQKNDDPWHLLSNYNAVVQSDVCLPQYDLNFWPQLDYFLVEKLLERHPDCLLILNYRDPLKIVSSIAGWGDLKERLLVADIPGLAAGKGSDIELLNWINAHYLETRQRFGSSENFLEIDIEDANARYKLGERLGVDIAWWGVANRNRRRR